MLILRPSCEILTPFKFYLLLKWKSQGTSHHLVNVQDVNYKKTTGVNFDRVNFSPEVKILGYMGMSPHLIAPKTVGNA